jgi:hypothetical protein
MLIFIFHANEFISMVVFNTVVSNHFHSVKNLLFSSTRSHDFDGLISIELLVSMYTICLISEIYKGRSFSFHDTLTAANKERKQI